jgi:sec-independent protein translocase protein TatA
MFGLGSSELLIIMGIFVLLFGASRIPELGRGIGSGIREFKNGLRQAETDDDEPEKKISTMAAKTPSGFGSTVPYPTSYPQPTALILTSGSNDSGTRYSVFPSKFWALIGPLLNFPWHILCALPSAGRVKLPPSVTAIATRNLPSACLLADGPRGEDADRQVCRHRSRCPLGDRVRPGAFIGEGSRVGDDT